MSIDLICLQVDDVHESVVRRNVNKNEIFDREAGPLMPFNKEESDSLLKRENDDSVLAPPQELPGEMGKAVVLPTNMSGEYFFHKQKVEMRILFHPVY